MKLTLRWFLVSICLCLFLPAAPASAESSVAAQQVAVLFLIDNSGSMKTSDPTDLRYAAAGLCVAALDEGDQVGMIRFATDSTPVTSGMLRIGSTQDQKDLVRRLQPVPPDGFTDVKAAFQSAGQMLSAANLQGYRVVVIFLTDGKPEVPSMTSGYEGEALQAARSLNVPVYAIALTNEGQSAFLTRLSQTTGGRVIPATSAANLLDSYLQILGDLSDRTIIGQDVTAAPGNASLEIDPALAPYVDKVTFLVSQSSGVSASLLQPDQKTLSRSDSSVDFDFTEDPRFAVYSIHSPAGGNWQFHLEGSGTAQARAILRSRLKAQVSAPAGLVEAGKPGLVAADLVETQPDGSLVKVVGDVSFSAVVTLPDGKQESLDALYDDGSHGDPKAGDGVYSRELVDTSQTGVYRVELHGHKGAIPVTAALQFEAVAFPTLQIESPLPQGYAVRTEAIPLVLHLQGNAAGQLQGGFIVQIKAPSGIIDTMDLTRSGERFQGSFLPQEDGDYTITYLPKEAAYLGLPYQSQAQVEFAVHRVPSLSISQTLFTSGDGRYELAQARQGIPLEVVVHSSAFNPLSVSFRLEALPGFALQETHPFQVDALGDTHLALTLLAGSSVQSGSWKGSLVLTAGERDTPVDLTANRQPIRFETFQPTLTVAASTLSACSQQRCWEWLPVQVILKTHSTSRKPEGVRLQLRDLPGMRFAEDSLTLQPGDGEIRLALLNAALLQPGSYHGEITLSGVRDGVVIQPVSTLPVSFVVDSPLTSCQRPVIFFGVGLLVAGLIGVRVVRRIKSSSRPPVVRGTLSHWPKNDPAQTVSIDLTALQKGEITLGKSDQCSVAIPDDSLEELHVRILAERGENDEVRYRLIPVGKVKTGYRERKDPFDLEENTRVQLGERIIQFQKDPD